MKRFVESHPRAGWVLVAAGALALLACAAGLVATGYALGRRRRRSLS